MKAFCLQTTVCQTILDSIDKSLKQNQETNCLQPSKSKPSLTVKTTTKVKKCYHITNKTILLIQTMFHRWNSHNLKGKHLNLVKKHKIHYKKKFRNIMYKLHKICKRPISRSLRKIVRSKKATVKQKFGLKRKINKFTCRKRSKHSLKQRTTNMDLQPKNKGKLTTVLILNTLNSYD